MHRSGVAGDRSQGGRMDGEVLVSHGDIWGRNMMEPLAFVVSNRGRLMLVPVVTKPIDSRSPGARVSFCWIERGTATLVRSS